MASDECACFRCEEFDTEIKIHGPDQLIGVAGKILAAVEEGRLHYNALASEQALPEQLSFIRLRLDEFMPDVLRYHFDCLSCHKRFLLEAETYHGSGGKWRTVEA